MEGNVLVKPAAGLEESPERWLRPGQHLFRMGDRCAELEVLTRGMMLSYCIDGEGDELVLDIHSPGDILGLDGGDAMPYGVLALEATQLRRWRHPASPAPGGPDADLQSLMSCGMQRLVRRHLFRLSLLRRTPRARLAMFLLMQSERYARQGDDARAFTLPLTRRQLAMYLELATETLSRQFSSLRERGLIRTQQRRIELLDQPGLRRLAGWD